MKTTATNITTWSSKAKTKATRVEGAHMSLQDLANISSADAAPINKGVARNLQTGYLSGQKLDSWHGTINKAQDAREYVGVGWRDGADKALGFISDIYASCSIPEPKNVRRQQVWAEDGDDLDYDKLMSGELETMWRTTKRNGKATNPHATLVINWGGNCNLKADALFWSGAVAIILADVLENAGYRIEIVGCITSKHDAGYSATSVTVKELDEPVRTDVLAGTLCEAGVFRSLGFMAMTASNIEMDSGLGYNNAGGFKTANIANMEESPFSEDVFVIDQCLTLDAAKKEIERVCNSLDETNG
jgi:hypothetical protein